MNTLKITFPRIERLCPFNNDPKNAKSKIYDFDVVIDGQRRAVWRKTCVGRGYYLTYADDWSPVTSSELSPNRKHSWLRNVDATAQGDFLRLTEKFLHLIPDESGYAARKAQRDEEERKEVKCLAESARTARLHEKSEELFTILKRAQSAPSGASLDFVKVGALIDYIEKGAQ